MVKATISSLNQWTKISPLTVISNQARCSRLTFAGLTPVHVAEIDIAKILLIARVNTPSYFRRRIKLLTIQTFRSYMPKPRGVLVIVCVSLRLTMGEFSSESVARLCFWKDALFRNDLPHTITSRELSDLIALQKRLLRRIYSLLELRPRTGPWLKKHGISYGPT